MINFFKKHLNTIVIVLCIVLVLNYIFNPLIPKDIKNTIEENKNLIEKISELEKNVKDREKEIEALNVEISNQKVEIIEKEKIIYKDGKLIIPEDYEELKDKYIAASNIIKLKDSVIDKLEKKSKKDDLLIIDLSNALKDAENQLSISNDIITSLSKKKWFQSVIIAGYDFESVDANYMIVIKEKIFSGIGFTSNSKIRVSVGVKL